MKSFIAGLVLGVVVASLAPVMADNPFTKGQSGKVREFDYYRQRQAQLDLAAMRRLEERRAAERAIGPEPCPR